MSCLKGKGIAQLQAFLDDTIGAQKYIGEQVPKSYLQLEKMLLAERDAKRKEGNKEGGDLSPTADLSNNSTSDSNEGAKPPIMTWEEFKVMAGLCLIEDEQELELAASFLHNLGSIIHFGDDEKLRDIIILEPQWLTRVMCTVITTKHRLVKQGLLDHTFLPFIWRPPQFPPHLHHFILTLLNRFEIAYTTNAVSVDGKESKDSRGSKEGTNISVTTGFSLIPSLLPEDKPELGEVWTERQPGDSVSEFGRKYKFSFVPAGFFGRIMVRLLGFNLDKVEKYWRYGLVISNYPEKVKVEFDPKEHELFISVRAEKTDEADNPTTPKGDSSSEDTKKKKTKKRASADNVHLAPSDQGERKKKKRKKRGSARRKHNRRKREKSLQTLSLLVFAAVDSLINDWYELDVQTWIPCTHCIDSGINPPFFFPFKVTTLFIFKSSSQFPFSLSISIYRLVSKHSSGQMVPICIAPMRNKYRSLKQR